MNDGHLQQFYRNQSFVSNFIKAFDMSGAIEIIHQNAKDQKTKNQSEGEEYKPSDPYNKWCETSL